MKVLVLGAGGGMGRVSARTVASFSGVEQLVIADLNGEAASKVAGEIGGPAQALQLDVMDKAAMAAALSDADLVFNCVGPFYRFGVPVLEQVIEAGCNYADICDDWEPTLVLLEQKGMAGEKGDTCVIGLGASPGAGAEVVVVAVGGGQGVVASLILGCCGRRSGY